MYQTAARYSGDVIFCGGRVENIDKPADLKVACMLEGARNANPARRVMFLVLCEGRQSMFMAIRAIYSQVRVFMMIFSRGHGHLERVSSYNRIMTQTPLHQINDVNHERVLLPSRVRFLIKYERSSSDLNHGIVSTVNLSRPSCMSVVVYLHYVVSE